MAYKFQLGPALLSGSVTQKGVAPGFIQLVDENFATKIELDAGPGAISGSGAAKFGLDLTASAVHAKSEIHANTNVSCNGAMVTNRISDKGGLLAMTGSNQLAFRAGGGGNAYIKFYNSSTGTSADHEFYSGWFQNRTGKTLLGADMSQDSICTFKEGNFDRFTIGNDTSKDTFSIDSGNSLSDTPLLSVGPFDKGGVKTTMGITAQLGLTGALKYRMDLAPGGGLVNSGTGVGPFDNTGNYSLGLSASVLNAAAPSVGGDSMLFYNNAGVAKRMSMIDYANNIAGNGITAVSGVLSVDTQAGDRISAWSHGDANANMKAGINYASAQLTQNRVWTLPSGSANVKDGEVFHVKLATLAAQKALVVTCQGAARIDDSHLTVVLGAEYTSVAFVYVGADKWRIV
tara:strand:+ start:15396 stop:16601 length:1206 start_codon:yes stop_codon:yes gene_type:complete